MEQSKEEIKNNEKALDKFKMSFFDLTGKVAVITGGNTGLGQGYAVALAEAGADIFIPTFGTLEWDNTRAMIEKRGRKVEFMDVDLTKPGVPQQVIDKVLETFGHIDILINNAGMIRRNPLLESKDEDWDKVININLNAVYHMSMAAAKVMAKQKSGKIINIGSMLSFQGGKFIPSYTASKHGVAGLTKSFASELGAYNIQVNAIAPGYIKTANTAPIRADKDRNKEILDRIPAGHWAEPSELMGVAVFLASAASNYVNGIILPVDGGYLVR
ncbi:MULTISPECIES: 2-dehydro-3-deoxy-D-gluconate 5-dehydrogenase KduD [Lactobacillus]|uniref:2 deoxy-D-gluconate 3-dehydrogenase n=1 Tax=Lactobacillus melliventris TaxID=1218507 RepID=A0A0F4LIP4_9LACO|nr:MULTISPECIES: 2-dehydro-3-deoxy-D-gluconate 5-dehydrogenase KduD [Lactobacillus]KJY57416.1 2 deoxy-D-gluconate 3-dehydrogenase [Lactobacillus melliventris]MBH9990266.1 2-dehydro-3-deoxy-D-gluconate 5-dehydrogenase KduD [Lactobacillus sp. M0392]MBI0024664.1 2-dehydro-3-deoxy-D-gluconate 5-dehydrogenase KduD [Lactobacillus sp. W8171]MBI0045288.1 2-dehydro-3-deoxy-D-gluconate 5-dehydrogenase KduD [Lactobacillus sp. M0393]NUE98403.1 2-dehydro-3-deoxy-D-gluconate 5-dehydrogenase KduD [Lactobacil